MSEDTNPATNEFDDLLGDDEEQVKAPSKVPTPTGFDALDPESEGAKAPEPKAPESEETKAQKAARAMKADAGPDDPALTREEDKRDPVLRAMEIHRIAIAEVKEIEAVLAEAKVRLNEAVELIGEVRQQVPLHTANKNAQRTTRVEIGRRNRAMESIRKMELHFRPNRQEQRRVRKLLHPGQ